jgi:hypothetical protein
MGGTKAHFGLGWSAVEGKPFQVVGLSFTGAEVKLTGERPPIGATIRVGKLTGRVVHHTAAGVAIEFTDTPGPLTRILYDLR